MMKGGFVVFKGPLKDNKGNEVVPGRAEPSSRRRTELESMGYLVEGVIGSTS